MTGGERRDLRGELKDFDGDYPESWKPAVGEIPDEDCLPSVDAVEVGA